MVLLIASNYPLKHQRQLLSALRHAGIKAVAPDKFSVEVEGARIVEARVTLRLWRWLHRGERS